MTEDKIVAVFEKTGDMTKAEGCEKQIIRARELMDSAVSMITGNEAPASPK